MDQPAPEPAKPPAPVARAKPKAARTTRDPASRLLSLLRKRGSLDNAAAREATGLDAAAVRLLLQRLVVEGHARIVGQKRGTRYVAT